MNAVHTSLSVAHPFAQCGPNRLLFGTTTARDILHHVHRTISYSAVLKAVTALWFFEVPFRAARILRFRSLKLSMFPKCKHCDDGTAHPTG